ncbi:MAG: hypothetical protein HOI31_02205 [Gammaproteobacteria bacterium]|jgi:hypothetical protein|nr:hypothetical protein [Thiotrichales bacterium]MBT5745088.1 hypothetical protein [Gammaproteobacteria bacterium]MBT7830527.1 hypothetical protein [Candidatus Neomarinimicrobiota bacterium]
MINLKTEHWTPQQAWAVYQVVEQLYDQLLEQHHESFRYYRWREEQLEEYCRFISQPDEGENAAVEEWLDSVWKLGDPEPF